MNPDQLFATLFSLGAIAVTAMACLIVGLRTHRQSLRREAAQRRADTLERQIISTQTVFDLAPKQKADGPAIVAWTPVEREAFGINETEKFISETEQELKRSEWDKLTAKP